MRTFVEVVGVVMVMPVVLVGNDGGAGVGGDGDGGVDG